MASEKLNKLRISLCLFFFPYIFVSRPLCHSLVSSRTPNRTFCVFSISLFFNLVSILLYSAYLNIFVFIRHSCPVNVGRSFRAHPRLLHLPPFLFLCPRFCVFERAKLERTRKPPLPPRLSSLMAGRTDHCYRADRLPGFFKHLEQTLIDGPLFRSRDLLLSIFLPVKQRQFVGILCIYMRIFE